MSHGVFGSLGGGYVKAGTSLFRYSSQQRWFIQPFTMMVAVIYAPLLFIAALGFYLFLIFDLLGTLLDQIRSKLLNLITRMADRTGHTFKYFFWGPIVICLVAPLFLLSLFIPKFSSEVTVGVLAEFTDLTGNGAFKTMNQACWKASGELFRYIARKPFYVMPVLAIIATLYSFTLLGIGLCFVILIPLDWISAVIEMTRQRIVAITNRFGSEIDQSLGQFLYVPVVLIFLAPIFLAVLLIPKFASNFDPDCL